MQRTQQGLFGKRLKVWMRPRAGGWKVPRLPIWVSFEWQKGKVTGVGCFNLSIADKYNHRPWAFNAYFYYKGV